MCQGGAYPSMYVALPLGPEDGLANAVVRRIPNVGGVIWSHLTTYVESLTDTERAAIGHVCITVYGGQRHASDTVEVLALPCGTGDIPSELLCVTETLIRKSIVF